MLALASAQYLLTQTSDSSAILLEHVRHQQQFADNAKHPPFLNLNVLLKWQPECFTQMATQMAIEVVVSLFCFCLNVGNFVGKAILRLLGAYSRKQQLRNGASVCYMAITAAAENEELQQGGNQSNC